MKLFKIRWKENGNTREVITMAKGIDKLMDEMSSFIITNFISISLISLPCKFVDLGEVRNI